MNAKLRLLLLLVSIPLPLSAQTYNFAVLDSFPASQNGSVNSLNSLISDANGNMYTTRCCGASDFGEVYRVAPNGVSLKLYAFTGGQDGGNPGSLARDTAGNLYGTTILGGANGAGTIFKVGLNKRETVLYSFSSGTTTSIVGQVGSLLRDPAGNLYGYAATGTVQTLFKLSTRGIFSTIYTFCSQSNCADGSAPYGTPIMDRVGNFYGTTSVGGAFGFGVVYKLTPQFAYTVLYNFTNGFDGGTPTGKLVQNNSGAMYGTALSGGIVNDDTCFNYPGCGTIFQITANGAFSVVYSFTGGTDGYSPFGALTLDATGNIYGVTQSNDSNDEFPTVFQITSQGLFTLLSTSMSAAEPGLVLDKTGDVFGTTRDLAFDGPGTSIYKLTK